MQVVLSEPVHPLDNQLQSQVRFILDFSLLIPLNYYEVSSSIWQNLHVNHFALIYLPAVILFLLSRSTVYFSIGLYTGESLKQSVAWFFIHLLLNLTTPLFMILHEGHGTNNGFDAHVYMYLVVNLELHNYELNKPYEMESKTLILIRCR